MERSFELLPDRNAEGISRQALQFFGVSLASLLVAAALMLLFCRSFGKPLGGAVLFPRAFVVSSVFLFAGSATLQRAVAAVRVEKQMHFRNWLVTSLGLGTLFVAVQGYALWSLFPSERVAEAATLGATAFILCLAALHGIHFIVAVLCVALVISRSWADRYDHEYYWGVRVCAWFWHILGIVWVAILAVIAIAL